MCYHQINTFCCQQRWMGHKGEHWKLCGNLIEGFISRVLPNQYCPITIWETWGWILFCGPPFMVPTVELLWFMIYKHGLIAEHLSDRQVMWSIELSVYIYLYKYSKKFSSRVGTIVARSKKSTETSWSSAWH